jgi:transcriptional regulator with XRE-family HTH domain
VTRVSPQRIREARLTANFSQDSLARRANTSAGNIGRWERGQHTPRPEHIAAIAEATGRPLAYFFSENGSDEDEESESMVSDLLNSLRKIVEAEAKRVRKSERVEA